MKTTQNTIDERTAIAVCRFALENGERISPNVLAIGLTDGLQQPARNTFCGLLNETVNTSILFSIAEQLFRWNCCSNTLGFILSTKQFGEMVAGIVIARERKAANGRNRQQHERAIDQKQSGCLRSRANQATPLQHSLDILIETAQCLLFNAIDEVKMLVPFDIRETTHASYDSHRLDRRCYDVYCSQSQQWYAVNLTDEQRETLETYITQNQGSPDCRVYLSCSVSDDHITKISWGYRLENPILMAVLSAITRFRGLEFSQARQYDALASEHKNARIGKRETFVAEWFDDVLSRLDWKERQLLDCLKNSENKTRQLDSYNLMLPKPISRATFFRRIEQLYSHVRELKGLESESVETNNETIVVDYLR